MIIATPLPNNPHIPFEFLQSLQKVKYQWITETGPSVAENRNKLIERARLIGEDILLIDSDIVFTPEDVKAIEEHLKTYDIISGVGVLGFFPYPPAIFKDSVPIAPKKEVFEVDSCWGAFLGISKKAINTIPTPFEHLFDKYGRLIGNDISFCMTAKKFGFKILCDGRISVGHIRSIVRYYEERRNKT